MYNPFETPFHAWSKPNPEDPSDSTEDPTDLTVNTTGDGTERTVQVHYHQEIVLVMSKIPVEATQEDIHNAAIRAYNTLIEERNRISTVV